MYEIDCRFLFLEKISQGGFGKVYLAYDKKKQEEVVVKVNSREDINDEEFKILEDLADISGFPKVV